MLLPYFIKLFRRRTSSVIPPKYTRPNEKKKKKIPVARSTVREREPKAELSIRPFSTCQTARSLARRFSIKPLISKRAINLEKLKLHRDRWRALPPLRCRDLIKLKLKINAREQRGFLVVGFCARFWEHNDALSTKFVGRSEKSR